MSPVTVDKDYGTQKLEAEANEAEASLKVLEAKARKREAKTDMDEISGLNALKEKVKKGLVELKKAATFDREQTKKDVERSVAELKAGLKKLDADMDAFDEAQGRRFEARLDEAEARLEKWVAKRDRKHAESGMKRNDELATLEEKIALARARSAESKQAKYAAKSQAALEEAARHFNEAYEAASKRYDKP